MTASSSSNSASSSSSQVSPITCHVLDSTLGKPGQGVQVRLALVQKGSAAAADGSGDDEREEERVEVLGVGSTNSDGRCTSLLPANHTLTSGTYKMSFSTGAYFSASQRPIFYPKVEIYFAIADPPEKHYHIPLLLSTYSYTTYRGS